MNCSTEKTLLMVQVCELYYKDNLSQDEIGRKLNISRSQISRVLTAAKEAGIVTFTINNPLSNEETYAEKIRQRYRIDRVIVKNIGQDSLFSAYNEVEEAAARLVESLIRDGSIIDVMAGKTVRNVCRAAKSSDKRNIRVVPAIGGWGSDGSDWHANFNAKIMGENLKGKYLYINAPSVVSLQASKLALLREPEIYRVIELAGKADILLTGIGQVESDSTMFQSLVYRQEDLEMVKKLGAAASFVSWFVDGKGRQIKPEAFDRQIGIELDVLKRIPNVVAVAYGAEKVEAIHALLSSGWATAFVTDATTAQLLLSKK